MRPVPAPAEPRSLAEAIRAALERVTAAERKAAMVLLANYPVPGLQTVAQFAAEAGVSGPTILRLTAKLGFASYAAFQQALRDELAARNRSPLAKAVPADGGGAAGDFLDRFRLSLVETVDQALRGVSRSEFQAVLAVLADARRPLSIVGGRFTSCPALQLYLHLRELRPAVQLIEGQTAVWPEYLLDMGRRNVLVVFDIRRYQEDVVRFAREAAALGAEIVLVTDAHLSPIAAVARRVLSVRTSVLSSWESLTTLCALNEAIVAALSAEHWPEITARIGRLEAIRGHLG